MKRSAYIFRFRHIEDGCTKVVLYQQSGVTVGSLGTELHATLRAHRVREHDGLGVRGVHRAEPPVEIVALDVGPELLKHGCAVVEEGFWRHHRTFGIGVGAIVSDEVHGLNPALSSEDGMNFQR